MPESSAPRIWPCLATLALVVPATIVAQSVGVLTIVGMRVSQDGTDSISAEGWTEQLQATLQMPGVFLLFLIVSQLVFACASLIPAMMSPQRARERLGLVRVTLRIRGIATTMIGSLFVWQLGMLTRELLFDEISPSLRSTAITFTDASPSLAILLVFCASVLPGFCEELLFRGYVQRRLLQRWPPLLAVGFTGLGFAAMHLDLQHIIAVAPLGLWLGYVAWRSSSTWPAIFCHVFVNATAFGTLVVMGMAFAEGTNPRFTFIIICLSLPFFLASLLMLERAGSNSTYAVARTDERSKSKRR